MFLSLSLDFQRQIKTSFCECPIIFKFCIEYFCRSLKSRNLNFAVVGPNNSSSRWPIFKNRKNRNRKIVKKPRNRKILNQNSKNPILTLNRSFSAYSEPFPLKTSGNIRMYVRSEHDCKKLSKNIHSRNSHERCKVFVFFGHPVQRPWLILV